MFTDFHRPQAETVQPIPELQIIHTEVVKIKNANPMGITQINPQANRKVHYVELKLKKVIKGTLMFFGVFFRIKKKLE